MTLLETFALSYATTTLGVFHLLLSLGIPEATLEQWIATYL